MNKTKKNIKQEIGITLIALVVTIIVLIILTGVSISLVLGQNGILSRAKEARIKTQVAQEKEQLELATLGSWNLNKNIDIEKLKSGIEREIENVTHDNAEDFPLKVTYSKTNRTYLVESDGNIIEYDENAVARTKEKFYPTLQAAINSISADNVQREVTLLKDVTENVLVNANQNINLNLNSKTVTGTTNKDYTIATNGMLTIQGNGKITGTKIGIRSWNAGKLRIINGTFEGNSEAVIKSGTSPSVILDGGTYNGPVKAFDDNNLTINGGTFNSTSNECVYANGNANLTINGGTFNSSGNQCANANGNANLTINGGTFNSMGNQCVYANGNANLIINDGTFNSTGNECVYTKDSVKLTINEGKFVGEKRAVKVAGSTGLTINGGNFLGKKDRCINCDGASNTKINKGIFNSDMTTDIYSGVIQKGSSGYLIIGNLSENNENILVNSNGNKKNVWYLDLRFGQC